MLVVALALALALVLAFIGTYISVPPLIILTFRFAYHSFGGGGGENKVGVIVDGWVGGLVINAGDMHSSPAMVVKPQRVGISSGRSRSRGGAQSGLGRRREEGGEERDWAATNKAPRRPGTADPHLMWAEGGGFKQHLAVRPSTGATKRAGKVSPKMKRIYGSTGNNKYGRVVVKHQGRKVGGVKRGAEGGEGVIKKMSDLQMSIAANKYFNPVNMAGYY
jgi:hypothetical protein